MIKVGGNIDGKKLGNDNVDDSDDNEKNDGDVDSQRSFKLDTKNVGWGGGFKGDQGCIL